MDVDVVRGVPDVAACEDVAVADVDVDVAVAGVLVDVDVTLL